MVPGDLRLRDVRVGRHIPVSPGAVPRFLARFEETYGNLGRSETIMTAAAAHHRLLWIHPFLDGNGRVARLMSHAVLLEVLDTGGIWSVARGLAHNETAYKDHLMACDQPRRNDLDGRGPRSEEALASFTRFFLETALDQVKFMEGPRPAGSSAWGASCSGPRRKCGPMGYPRERDRCSKRCSSVVSFRAVMWQDC